MPCLYFCSDLEVILGNHPPGSVNKKTVAVKKKHVFEDDSGEVHDLMLLQIGTDTKLPTIDLPPPGLTCQTPAEGSRVKFVGMMQGSKKGYKKGHGISEYSVPLFHLV